MKYGNPTDKSKITRAQFLAFVKVQRSGKTNMLDVVTVSRLAGGLLKPEDVRTIIEEYDDFESKWGEEGSKDGGKEAV